MKQATENKPGLRDYWQIFLRRKWIIILPTIVIVSIAIPGSFLLTPVYQASTTLISQEVEVGSVLQGVANIPIPRAEQMSTVRQKIESRKYMKEVADKVGVAEHLRSIGKEPTIDDVVRYLRKIVTLRARGGKIIEISATHSDPIEAKNIADTVANTYVDKTLMWRQSTVTDTTSFIEQELETYKRQLREAEEALVAAQEKGVLDSLSGEDNTLITELAKLRTDLVEVELDLQEAKSELQSARGLPARYVKRSYSSAFYNDPEVAALEAKLVNLKTQYAELSIKYTEQYPDVKVLKGEIILTEEELNRVKANRQQDVGAGIQYWNDKVRTLEIKKTVLNDKISEYNRSLQKLPQRQLELARLQREKAAAESTYSMLLQRMNESKLLQSSELQNMGRVAEILDPAIVPDHPVKPKRNKIAFLAVVMGMMIGFGSAFILEYFDRSFRSVDEAADYLDLTVLGAIPKIATFESEREERRRRYVKIACIASVSLLALILIADIVSAQLFTRNSFFLNIARSGVHFLRRQTQ